MASGSVISLTQQFYDPRSAMKTCMLLLLLWVANLGVFLRPLHAQDWDPTKIELTQTALENAARHAKAIGCKTQECSSLIRLQFLDQYVEQYTTGGNNSIFDPIINDRYGIARRRLDFHLLHRRKLYQPFCAYMVKLFQYKHAQKRDDEIIVPIEILLYGIDMDTTDHGHCTEDLSNALSDTPGNKDIREGTENVCKIDSLIIRRSLALCKTARTYKHQD